MAEFRANFRGRHPGDVWQFGFVLQSDEGIDGLSDRLASQCVSMLTTALRGDFTTGTIWDDVYVSELATGSGQVLNTAFSPINVAGTASTGLLPPQCSLAVTILPLAGTAKGRFYLPPMNTGVVSSVGRFSITKQGLWADAWQGFFSALGSSSAPARLGIWTTSSQSFRAARGIQVGDVIDTQRRRRNKILESRVDRIVL